MPSTFPCTVFCKFNVHNKNRAIFCDSCHNWTHLKCTPFTRLEYSAMSKSNDGWFCSTCLASIFPLNHFDNDIDFFFALFGFNSQGDFDTDLLKQKNFNPFFVDPKTSHLLLNSNLDPDTNFFSANSELLSNCLYLTSTEFNKMPSLPPNTFPSLHINIRSLPNTHVF